MVDKVERTFCMDTENQKNIAILQKSVKRLIKKNQQVFDKLAKS
jgi:hypothetical protein